MGGETKEKGYEMQKIVFIAIAALLLTGCVDIVPVRETQRATESEIIETDDKIIVETETEPQSETEEATEAITETERETVTIYVKEGVNIRRQQTAMSERIGGGYFGESYTAYADSLQNEFTEIMYEGGTAYMYSPCITTDYNVIAQIRAERARNATEATESAISETDEQFIAETEITAENEPQEATEAQTSLEYVGNYRITAYMWTGDRMANGLYPEIGYVATGSEFPFGTVLYIDGFGYYTVGDRGVPNGWIDIYMGTYEACCQVGSQYRDVYIVR